MNENFNFGRLSKDDEYPAKFWYRYAGTIILLARFQVRDSRTSSPINKEKWFSMERFVLFSEPLKIDIRPRGYDELVVVPVLGFRLPDGEFSLGHIADYIKYLMAELRWENDGNHTIGHRWITKEGVLYVTSDPEIMEYIHSMDAPRLTATIWMTEEKIDIEGFIYEFIFDPDIKDTIMRKGEFVDVVMAPSMVSK